MPPPFSIPWLLRKGLQRVARTPADVRRFLAHHRMIEEKTVTSTEPLERRVFSLKHGQFEGATQRTGWGIALGELKALGSPDGVELDGFVESNFCWKWKTAENRVLGRIPYRTPWTGIVHFPPNIPEWSYPGGTWNSLLHDRKWTLSAPECVGLFALTEYHAEWIRENVGVRCDTLSHPVLPSGTPFTMEAFRANERKGISLVGWWLRKLDTFFTLKTTMKKTHVFQASTGALLYAERYRRHVGFPFANGTVDVVDYVSNADFDAMLSKNIAFLDVLDTSANNIVLDCIIRNTPLLASRHPALEEYLGKDYPFFFSSIDEASSLLGDERRIEETHEYLRSMDKTRFSPEHFRRGVIDSSVFRAAQDIVRQRRI